MEDGCVFEKGDKLEPSSFQAWHVMLLPLVMACMVNVLYHKHTRTEWGGKKNKSDERERTSVSHFEEGKKNGGEKRLKKDIEKCIVPVKGECFEKRNSSRYGIAQKEKTTFHSRKKNIKGFSGKDTHTKRQQ